MPRKTVQAMTQFRPQCPANPFAARVFLLVLLLPRFLDCAPGDVEYQQRFSRYLLCRRNHDGLVSPLGDNAGLLLRGVDKKEIERGMVLAKPGSVTPHTKFDAEVYVLKKDEGGRHTPFFKGYRPQFYFRTTDVTGSVELPEGVEMVMPGDNTKMNIELITPIAMEEGLRFAVREGGRTVGAGVVTKIHHRAALAPGHRLR